MPTEHYFTASPASPSEMRERTVTVRGREHRVVTAAGVFSQDGLDHGTKVLLDHVDNPPAEGVLVDLGCGWGPIALALADAAPAAQVIAVDVNERALDLTRRNAEAARLSNITALEATDALADPRTASIDELWSNPPVRIGKQALHELLGTWLPRLSPTGAAHLVVQKNLGADSLHRWLEGEGYTVERTASSKGFRVLRVRRA